jgi:histidinol-phosphate/aromatic aminotransferase/cobyric acid decarboxylase-like protein
MRALAPQSVVTGCWSTQVLRVGVQVFTSPARPLVAGQLTYEECADYADLIGTAVRAIPLDRALQLDLGAMADAARGAGMVFLNNPNNPPGTVHSGDAVDGFIERVLAASPDAVVMIDEAYHDTTDWFARKGLPVTDSQTNFIFVDIKRPAKGFREACREQGVLVARDFPPFEKSHVRVSIGTLDEMRRATEVVGRVLGVRG